VRPTTAELLIGASRALQAEPSGEEGQAFARSRYGAVALVVTLLAQEAESGAAVRAAENDGFRALFARAAAAGWIPALQDDLVRAAGSKDEGLTLSALDTANGALRTLVIALHEAVERSSAPERAARERDILELLHTAAARRVLSLPGPAEPPT
jgi:hypothetical protein